MFHDQGKRPQIYFDYDFSPSKESNFLTLNSKFILPMTTLKTSDANFLRKAESNGIIGISYFENVYQEESSYAAS